MTITCTRYLNLCAAVIMIAAFSSCSRPVTYFQPGPVNLLATSNTQPVALPTPDHAIALPAVPSMSSKADSISTRPEFYTRSDSKVVLNETLSRRMDRVRKLSSASTVETLTPTGSDAVRRITGMERLMLKKLNKKIGQQRLPGNSEKVTGNRIKLIGGIVLLLIGVVVMIAAPSQIFFLGLIVTLLGAVGIIVGLFGE